MNVTEPMRRFVRTAGLLSLASFLALTPASSYAQCADDDLVGTEILVVLRENVPVEATLQQIVDVVAATYPDLDIVLQADIATWGLYNYEVGGFPDGADTNQPVKNVAATIEQLVPNVDKAEPHRLLETPEGVQLSIPDLGVTATLQDFTNQPATSTINVIPAQQSYTGAGVVVAVLDTGMSFDHPFLAGRLIEPGAGFIPGDGTGEVQANQIDDDSDGLVDESVNHATFVGGLISLVAPDAYLLPIRVLEEDGNGSAFAVAQGIHFAIQSNADVIVLAQTMLHDSRAVEIAIEEADDANIPVIAAAGNSGMAIVDASLEDCGSFPASVPGVIAVAAVDANLVKPPFSDYGPQVDLSAPGIDLLSSDYEGEFAMWSGTSFAVPLVAGGVALLLEKYPGLTPAEITAVLQQTAQPDNNPPELDGLMGTGVLDLEALTLALTRDRTSLKLRQDTQGTVISWSPVLSATGYDIARGSVSELELAPDGQTVNLGQLTCIADDLAATELIVTAEPAVGEPWFFLFRDDVVDPADPGAGNYGSGSDYRVRISGPSDCPVP